MAGSLISLLLVLLALGLLTAAAAAALMALGLLRPPRMNDGKALYLLRRLSPWDLGMPFEEVSFVVTDEASGGRLGIAGWWIPAPARPERETGRCAVLLHGYSDAKVGAIAWAGPWRELGFHVLALDLRAHGESEGTFSTGGWFERHDVAQVIDQLRADRPAETRHVVLFGVSLGASVALAAAEVLGQAGPGVVSAVVLESPFADFRGAALRHMDRLGLPVGWIGRAAVALAQWRAHADFGAVRPVDLLRRVRCPVMVICARTIPRWD